VISTGALLSTWEVPPPVSTLLLSDDPQPAKLPTTSDAIVSNVSSLFFMFKPSLSFPVPIYYLVFLSGMYE
jgi:hypothetical protein